MTDSAERGSTNRTRWTALGVVYIAPPVGPTSRAFGLTVGGVLVGIAAFSAWRGHVTRAEIVGVVGIALVAAAVLVPRSLAGLAAGWARVGHVLGWFNSRVLLTVTFGLVLCPIALLGRLMGNDPLSQRRGAGSFWVDYPARLRDLKHFERLF